MNYDMHFRHEDIEEAKREFNCIKDLQRLIELNLNAGKAIQAEKRAIELLRSVSRLVELNKKKMNDDKFADFINQVLENQESLKKVEVFINE